MKLKFAFRMPGFPMIVVRGRVLHCARTPQSLSEIVTRIIQGMEDKRIVFIDASGKEFVFFAELETLSPTLPHRPWSKGQLVELYNSSLNAKNTGTSYSKKSLSAKGYQRVFEELAQMIERNRP